KRAYCLKTQPATGETYPKSDLFNKAGMSGSMWWENYGGVAVKWRGESSVLMPYRLPRYII
ncbi:hypothetical protein KW485_18240, partial [Enterobacter kobei]|uniref:hypothetical protein n=1 Tax=Enterobacter kobei TaxID=208224 RepID=UPI00217555AB